MKQLASCNFDHTHRTDLLWGTISSLADRIAKSRGSVIIDDLVYQLYKKELNLSDKTSLLFLSAGEKNKTMRTVELIYNFLSEASVTRESIVYVLGGGSVTDVASYAVSTFKRGCGLVLIPTTLLGMVDAAVGGKTAVNSGSTKNNLGTFYPAAEIILLPEFQSTLSVADLQNGLAEMLKLWFIDSTLSEPYPNEYHQISQEQISEYAKAKLAICSNDLEDRAGRRLLNLGHTFGHILESVSNYNLPHGQSVAMGIVIALRLSCELGKLDRDKALNMEQIISKCGFDLLPGAEISLEFLHKAGSLVKQDKKAGKEGLTLILFSDYRQVFIEESLDLNVVMSLLPACLSQDWDGV